MCKSIHHMGSDRASCRMRIALGENHRESGVTLKVRVTWGAVNDSLCTVFSTPAIREGQATRPLDFAVENGIGRVRNPVVSSGRLGAFDFLGEVHPNRAALQPCLDGPAWKADHRNLKAVRSLDCATPCSKARYVCPGLIRELMRRNMLLPVRFEVTAPPTHDHSPLLQELSLVDIRCPNVVALPMAHLPLDSRL